MGKISRIGNVGLAYKTNFFVYWASQEKLEVKFMGWRSTLINSVAQAIPNYIMYSFSMLNKVCDKLDALSRRFWLKSKDPEGKFLF